MLGGQGEHPVLARAIGMEIRMKPNVDRHWRASQVVNLSRIPEPAVLQTVGHLNGVSERELRHQVRILVEIEVAGHKGSFGIGRPALHHTPPFFEHQQPMDRVLNLVAQEIADRIVQEVLLALEIVILLADAISIGREKRDA